MVRQSCTLTTGMIYHRVLVHKPWWILHWRRNFLYIQKISRVKVHRLFFRREENESPGFSISLCACRKKATGSAPCRQQFRGAMRSGSSSPKQNRWVFCRVALQTLRLAFPPHYRSRGHFYVASCSCCSATVAVGRS